jgi:predicted RNase H-like HicB family nuclease
LNTISDLPIIQALLDYEATLVRYTIMLEPTNEPDRPGWYYAHIPALDLTTHGLGPEGAMAAAYDLLLGWIAELKSRGEEIPQEKPGFISQIEISDDAINAA